MSAKLDMDKIAKGLGRVERRGRVSSRSGYFGAMQLAAEVGARFKMPVSSGLREVAMDEKTLLRRITVDPTVFGGKPIIRGHRLAVEHVLAMLAAGDSAETILSGYAWMEREDILACVAYARAKPDPEAA
jgi:uncharacterized protein (DUF433 family)